MAEIRVELRDFTDSILGNLDITSSDDFPLSLNYQNFDIRDFNSRSGSFSKTFKVPATRNNNKLFNHIYKDGNIDSKNVLKDLPSTIYADHLPIMNGKLRVSQIYKNTDVLEYECLFLADNMDWADKIKNADLDELRFSSTAYSSYENISSSSWVFENPRTTYPDYAKVLQSADEELVEFDTAVNSPVTDNRSLGNQSYTLGLGYTGGDFTLPFIVSADTLTDDAPSQAGLDTDDYGNAQLGTEHTGGIKNGLIVASQASGLFNIKGSVTVEVETDGASFANALGLSFTQYKVVASIIKFTGANDDANSFDVVATGTTDATSISHVTPSTNEHQFNFQSENPVEATQNDIFAIKVDFVHINTPLAGAERPKLKVITKAQSYLQIEQTSAYFNGEDIKNIHNMLPKGKQSDFVKGLAQMFNLHFETDPISKTVYVEPYEHFYENTSNAVNWTEKVDYSKTIKDEFLFDIKSKLIFKYKDASGDGLLDKYNKRNAVDWGSYEETDTSGKFQTGEYKIENSYFSPTFNWYEPNYIYVNHIERSPLIPMYFSDDTDLSLSNAIERPEKEFEIGARILLKDGGYYSSFNGKRQWQYYDPDNLAGGNSIAYKSWNKSSFIAFDNLISSTSQDTPAINTLSQATISNGYENVDYNLSFSDINHDTVISSSQQKLRGLFYNYYSKMVAQLKQNPRVKVLYINLSKLDISKLNFRKLIFIDGSYYRLNKIIDFKPHDKQSTKVELQEYFLLGKSNVNTTVDIDVENLNM